MYNHKTITQAGRDIAQSGDCMIRNTVIAVCSYRQYRMHAYMDCEMH